MSERRQFGGLRIDDGNAERVRDWLSVEEPLQVDINGKPMCQPTESEEQASKRHEWSYSAPIASIEITPGAAKKPQLISGLEIGEDSSHVDATDPFLPHWVLDVKNRKRSSKLVFMPLDVRGVEFVARFPTAKSRLDNQD